MSIVFGVIKPKGSVRVQYGDGRDIIKETVRPVERFAEKIHQNNGWIWGWIFGGTHELVQKTSWKIQDLPLQAETYSSGGWV